MGWWSLCCVAIMLMPWVCVAIMLMPWVCVAITLMPWDLLPEGHKKKHGVEPC